MQTDTVAIGIEEGQVVFAFQEPVKWLKLDPITGLRVGEEVAKKCYEITYGKPPSGESALKIETVNKLTRRVELVVNNLIERKRPPAYIAREIVDIILSEVR